MGHSMRLELILAGSQVKLTNHYTTRCALCDIVVNEFEHQSRYYVQLWISTLGKSMNSLIPLIMPQSSYKDGFNIK